MAPSTDPAAIAAHLIRQAQALEQAILAARDGVERKGQRSELARAARAARRVVAALNCVVTAKALKRGQTAAALVGRPPGAFSSSEGSGPRPNAPQTR
jgi:hypothetical protein